MRLAKMACTAAVLALVAVGYFGWPGTHVRAEAMGEDERLPKEHLDHPEKGEPPLVDIVQDKNESYKDFPYPEGWPVILPGCISGTPVVADLWGDGKLAVIAPSSPARGRNGKLAHPEPSQEPLLY